MLKKFLIFLLFIFVAVYLCFVAVLPFAIQPIKYKADLQKIVKDSCNLDFDFNKAKIVTTPMLGIGLKADNISLSMPENNNQLVHADNLLFRISLPSLLFKTIKITAFEISNLQLNADINKNGTQYEIVDFLSAQNQQQNEEPVSEEQEQNQSENDFLSNLKFKINKFNIKNYSLNITDKKTNNKLVLKGNNFYAKFDGKNLICKSQPQLMYNDKTNITADFDINTIIPEMEAAQNNNESQETEAFINPVEMFGKYNLNSNIKSKLKIDKINDKFKINGNLYITDTTMKISDVVIPSSYLKLDFNGYEVKTDANIFLAENEKAELAAFVKYDKDFNTDISLKSDKINLASIFKLSQAILNSLNIQNSLNLINARGYITADMKLNTDLKKIKSQGKIALINGYIKDGATGLVLNNMKSNILFDNNAVKIQDTETTINGTPFVAKGTISENSDTDIRIFANNLSLEPLYKTFAPAEIKNNYAVKNGILSLDIILNGKLKNIEPKIKTEIVNLAVKDLINKIDITNGNCTIDINTNLKTYEGAIKNKNLVISAPELSSTIRNIAAEVIFDDRNLTLKPASFVLNGVSDITLQGNIANYTNKPEFNISGNGNVRSIDIKNLLGKDLYPYIKSSGVIPVKLLLTGNDKKQNFIFRAFGTVNDYITPIDIAKITGKPSTLQVMTEIENNKVTFKDSGLYAGSYDNLNTEIKANPILMLSGSVNLDKNMTLNNIKVATNGAEKIGLYAFDNSSLNIKTDINVTGNASNPVIKGSVTTDSIDIPQLRTKIKKAEITLNSKTFGFDIRDLNLNDTSLDLEGSGLLDFKPITTITDVKISSDYLDSDKAVKVTEYMTKVPALNQPNNGEAIIPMNVLKGTLNLKKLSSGEIIANDIESDITLKNNTVYLPNLKANAFDGVFQGNVSMNLITTAVKASVSGNGMNADKTVSACAGMKNTIFGTLGFNSDITLKGATYQEQMATLNGKADFNISKGQFGTLGRFETFLKADNIASLAFISTKIGSVINKVSPHNTADFEKLEGNVTFKNGNMDIASITSAGKNMSMYITGALNLNNNNANMLVLGRISQEVASLLGPLQQVNPVNLLKSSSSAWAGITLNIINAINEKALPSEMNKIPQLIPAPSTDNSSKFIVKIAGNIEKPQSAIKSFKWLAPEEDLSKIQTTLSPKEVINEVVKDIPKTKEEVVNTLKEAGKNSLINLGKQLLVPNTNTASGNENQTNSSEKSEQ